MEVNISNCVKFKSHRICLDVCKFFCAGLSKDLCQKTNFDNLELSNTFRWFSLLVAASIWNIASLYEFAPCKPPKMPPDWSGKSAAIVLNNQDAIGLTLEREKHGRNSYRSTSFIVHSNKRPLCIPDSGQPSPLAFQCVTRSNTTVHHSPFATFLGHLGPSNWKDLQVQKGLGPSPWRMENWNRHFFSLKTNMTITVLKIHNLNEDGSISYWISGDFPAIVMLVFGGTVNVWINIQLVWIYF